MSKPNANEKAFAKRAVALLKRAEKEVEELDTYLICREVGASFRMNNRAAFGAIDHAIEELSKIAGIPVEVTPDVAAAEG